MDSSSENVAENEKYAFLLGSALRNGDTDQFFSVYDAIIPKDLPDSQVDSIKDSAREVAALPEEEFNSLVSKARDFSLAPTGTPNMSSSRAQYGKWTRSDYCNSSEEDEGVGSTKAHGLKSETSSQYSSNETKTSFRSSESDARRLDDDSGVCNSSKATNSIGSLSGSDSEEGDAYFDYFPTSQVKIHSGGGLHLDYDEAHEVQSDTGRSSPDMISPRSDISVGRSDLDERGYELQTFRLQQQDDFNTDEDSDEADHFVSSNRMFGRSSYHHNYMPMERESKDDHREFRPSFERSRPTWTDSSTSSLRTTEVDDVVQFPCVQNMYSRYSDCNTARINPSSDKVRIEKNTYKKSEPPFGRGHDQLKKVGSSLDPLLSGINKYEVSNLPAARELVELTSDDRKKKKKKKRGSKDEVDKYEKDTGGRQDLGSRYDINGNPIDRSSYRQMREAPSYASGGSSKLSSNHATNYGAISNSREHVHGGFSPEIFDFSSQPTLYSTQNRDLDDASQKLEKLKRRKEQKKEKVLRSEDIENYVGKKDIDELLKFIGAQDEVGRKTKSASNNDIPGKSEKNNRKNKEKKQKSPAVLLTSNSFEEKDTKDLNDSEAKETASIKSIVSQTMGNSGAKTENIVENGEVDDEVVIEKENKVNGLLKKEEFIPEKSAKKKMDGNITNVMETNSKSSASKLGSKASAKQIDISKTISSSKNMEDVNSAENKKCAGKNKKTRTEVETSNSVKQKNAKNAKSKPCLSETDSSVPNSAIKVQADVKDTSAASNFTMESHPFDAEFIFTDLDNLGLVPTEEEFQVVGGKKKKKTNIQDNHTNHVMPVYKQSQTVHHHPTKQRPHFTNSKTLPVVPIPTHSSFEDSRSRDLSPSAFPALGNGTKIKQDGRRNSAGDLETGTKVQDDSSDLESVKSLPASREISSEVSPRVISYAKMAASPRPAGGGIANVQGEGSLSSVEDSMERKQNFWKGSPTERRHSIGSRPEEKIVSSVSESTSPALRVKTGSQEVLVDSAIIDLDISTVEERDPDHCDFQKSDKSVPCQISENKSEIILTTIDPMLAKESSHLSSSVQSASKTSKLPLQNNINELTSSGKEMSSKGNDKSSQKISSFDTKQSQVVCHKHKGVTKASSKVNNNHKKLKTKSSVIFLDKRVEEASDTLDITFGFEVDSLTDKGDPSSKPLTQTQQCLPSYENSSNFVSKDSEHPFPESDKITNFSPANCNSSVSTNLSSSVVAPSEHSSSSVLVKDVSRKVSSHIAGLNGVVTSLAQATSQQNSVGSSKPVTSKENTTVNQSNLTLTSTIASTNQEAASEKDSNSSVVYYGEGVCNLRKDSSHMQSNGPVSYCGHVQFQPEAGDVKGQFNINDAVSYLQREWYRVMQMQDKDPVSVTVLNI